MRFWSRRGAGELWLRRMPREFEPLVVWNTERHRGLVHTADYDAQMAELRRRFDAWRRRE